MPSIQEAQRSIAVNKSNLHFFHAGEDNLGLAFNLLVDNSPSGIQVIAATASSITRAFPDTNGMYISANTAETPPIMDTQRVDRSVLNVQLQEINEECSVDGLDTAASKAVSQQVVQLAYSLIPLIPPFADNPDIIAENDGAIAFEWYNAKGHFIISINPNNDLYYISKVSGKKSRGCIEHSDINTRDLLMYFLKMLSQ